MYKYWIVLFSLLLLSCETIDVEPITGGDVEGLYQINDLAFAEYLDYNTTLEESNANKLPSGIVVRADDGYYLDVESAATVDVLYLVKDNNRMSALEEAGVASARDKIESLDGIQFFTNVVDLKLTSNTLSGKLDLSMLPKLEVIEMNSNYVNELILPASVTRLRYAASTSASAPDDRWLTAIDLLANNQLHHVHLPNHRIEKETFLLPENPAALREVNVSGNTGAPFEVSEGLYNQLTTRDGLIVEIMTPPIAAFVEILDVAFGDYLIHNSNLPVGSSNKLPEGTAFLEDGKRMLNTAIAATVEALYLVKDNTRIGNLRDAGVPTAEVKISNLAGIEYFTNVKDIKLTSNVLTGKLDLSALVMLEVLEMNSNYVDELVLPESITRLRYAASTSSSAPDNRWLTGVDLTNCSRLDHLHLPNHHITASGLKLPTSYGSMIYIDLSGNVGAPFSIPAALYSQLTTKNGVVSQ